MAVSVPAALVAVVAVPVAKATGTVLFQNSFANRTVNGTAANQVGGVFGQESFPTSGGLDVTFTSYQWGGIGGGGDGLAFMLAAAPRASAARPSHGQHRRPTAARSPTTYALPGGRGPGAAVRRSPRPAKNLAGTGPASAPSPAVTPNQSSSLTFAAPPAGEVGVAYNTQLAATAGTSPFGWSVSGAAFHHIAYVVAIIGPAPYACAAPPRSPPR